MRSPNSLTRLAIGVALVSLLPLLFVSWQLVSLNRQSMRDQVMATNIVAAATISERLATQLDSWQSLAHSLTLQPAMERAESAELGLLLRDTLQAWNGLGVMGLAIVDPQSQLVVGTRARAALDLGIVTSAEWLALTERRPTPPAAEDPPASPQPPSANLAFVPLDGALLPLVRSPIGELGFVVVFGEPEFLARPLEARNLLSAQAELFAIDPSGRLVAGQGEVDKLPSNLLDAATSRRIAEASLFEADAEHSEGQQAAAFLAALDPVDGWPLTVLSIQPREVAEAVARAMRQRALLIVVLAVALVALLFGAVYAVLVRPLRRLLGAQRRLAQLEDGEGSDDSDDPAAGDLIRELEDTFSALEERVRDSEQLGKIFLGRYQVVELVGRGGMGTVFRGWDPKLERSVALKTVRLGTGEMSDSPNEARDKVRSLLQEAVLVAQLNHPNVVTVYDFEEIAGSAFLAMELVDGITLEQLHYYGEIDAELIAPLGLCLSRALEAAHDRGVLHRDIKSPNVLLGRDDSVKVVDFGLAQLANAAKSDDGMIFGTPGYVAPEVIHGEPVTAAADLFALGVVLYESAAGVLPFTGVNIPAMLRSTVRGEYEPLASHRPQLDAALLELIDELLQVRPEMRPAAPLVRNRLEELTQRLGQIWRLPRIEDLDRDKTHHTTKARAQWINTTTFGMQPSARQRRGSDRRQAV